MRRIIVLSLVLASCGSRDALDSGEFAGSGERACYCDVVWCNNGHPGECETIREDGRSICYGGGCTDCDCSVCGIGAYRKTCAPDEYCCNMSCGVCKKKYISCSSLPC